MTDRMFSDVEQLAGIRAADEQALREYHGYGPAGDVGLHDATHPADYLVQWIETGCQWHAGIKRDAMDARAERDHYAELEQEEPTDTGDELDVWARELAAGADTPAWWVEWASRLVYVPKFEYLVRLGAHAWLGAGEPRDPGTDWSAKMRRQWARRSTRCDRIVP